MSNDVVFTDLSGTKEEILSQLFIGAPSIPSGSTPESKFKCVNTDCLVEYIAHNTLAGTVDVDTVFEVQDFAGRTFLLKNLASANCVRAEGLSSNTVRDCVRTEGLSSHTVRTQFDFQSINHALKNELYAN